MSELWNSLVQNLRMEMGAGKYLALVLMALFFLWLLGRYKKTENTRHLLLFGITISALVLIPVFGMPLMVYQTRFYNFRHLLLLLFPMVMIPWALTEALEQGVNFMKRSAEEEDFAKKNPWITRMLGAVVAICLLIISGNLLTEGVEVNFTFSKEKVPANVMEVLELLEDGDVLVAPNEVIEYARAYDGDLRLVYGRDMWQHALRAYTYNTYDDETCELYDWMQNKPLNYFNLTVEEKAKIQKEADDNAMEYIAKTTCNVLVLPHVMYERVWLNLGADGMQGFEMIEETSQYVVLVRR